MRDESEAHEPTGNGFVHAWSRVMTAPRTFFRAVPLDGPLSTPFLFVCGCVGITAVAYLILGQRDVAVRFVVAPVFRGPVWGGLSLLLARQLFGGRGDFATTLRVGAYACAPGVLYWIPGVEPFAILYTLYFIILAVERIHGIGIEHAVLTILLVIPILALISWSLGSPWWFVHPSERVPAF